MRAGIALSGTGASWLIHAGALEAFDNAGVEPSLLFGTSGGALVAALAACNVAPREILELAHATDFAEYIDLKPHRLLWMLGMNDGRKLEALIEEWTRGLTFERLAAWRRERNLPACDLFITGTDILTPASALSPHRRRVACFNHWSTPHLSIARAVRISISLPFVFRPVEALRTLWVDGGVNAATNYPFELMERAVTLRPEQWEANLPLIGVNQVPAHEPQGALDPFAPLMPRPGRRKRLGLREYVGSLVHTMRDDQQRAYVRGRYADCTVFVPVRPAKSLALNADEIGTYYTLGRMRARHAIDERDLLHIAPAYAEGRRMGGSKT